MTKPSASSGQPPPVHGGAKGGLRVGVNTLFLIPDEVGGSEVHLRGVLGVVRAVDPSVQWVVFTNRENHESFPGFERVLIDVAARSRPRRVLAEQTTLVRAAREAHVDVLYSPGYTGPVRAPCPQVLTLYDVQFLDFPEDFPWLSRQVQRIIIGKAVRNAQAITTVSEFSRGRITMRLGIPPERIVVTGSGLSGSFAAPQPCAVEKRFLLYVSNTYPHKNAGRLVRAFTRIAGQVPHDLIIVGQPRAGEPPAHPRVKRLHHVPHETLAGLYQACELFVFPSLYEGFGRPVIEAMEAGTRVIASNAAAIPEIGGEAATYFDATDEHAIAHSILDALHDPPEQRQRFIRAGRRHAKRFSWEHCARKTIEALANAAGRTSPSE